MSATDWTRAREVFEVALDVPPAERVSYLDDACRDDDDLRRVVNRLITDATDQEDSWLDEGVSAGLVRRALSSRSLEGQRIDDYVIRGVVGSGGMATVFEAEQQQPRRPVALKIMRFGFHSPKARQRFEYESDVLARLQHPGIAQVFASGTYHDELTDQELPYFAMELVAGARTLVSYVTEKGLDLEQLLALFVKICDAVHYGHLRGFIHRDLKPLNILVDGEGRPKIIDFGIARTVGPASPEQTLRTLEGEVLGTLSYMSPEQIDGEANTLDLRSDVYALGVILFQLLAGRLPFDLSDTTITAAIQTIAREAPPAPSRCGSRFAEVPQIDDLDCIVLKAIDKDPTRRYASVADLAADLERVLRDQPILARPPSRLYLAKKFVQRHRVAVSSAAIVLVALLVAVIVTTISLFRAVAAEEQAFESLAEAQLEAESRESVNDFLMDMLSAVSPYQDGREVKVIDLLDRASESVHELHANRPALSTALRATLGNTYYGLGEIEQALEHLERALAISEEHLERDHRLRLWTTHLLATCYLELDRIDEATELAEETLVLRERKFGHLHDDTARSLIVLAVIAYRKNDLDEAVRCYSDARAIFLELDGPGSRMTVQASAGLGTVLETLGRDEQAAEMLRFAVDQGSASLGDEQPSVLTASNNLATLLMKQGKLAEAAERLEKVVVVGERVLGKNHSGNFNALNNLASALHKLGRIAEAERRYRDLLERRRAAGQYEHHLTAIVLSNLAVCLESQDRLDEAETTFGESLALLETCGIPEDHWLNAACRKGLAVVWGKQGRHAEAVSTLKECLVVFESSRADQRARIRRALEALAEAYDDWDKPELARAVREQLAAR